MNILSNFFGQQGSVQSANAAQQQSDLYQVQQNQLGQPGTNYNYTVSTQAGELNIYNPGISVFDLDAKTKEVESNHTTHAKNKEILDNLSPETKEVIKIMGTIRNSNDVNDLVKVDKYIKGILFKSKLEQIID